MVTKTTEHFFFLFCKSAVHVHCKIYFVEAEKKTSVREKNKGCVVCNNVSYVSPTKTLSKLSNARIAFSMYNETVPAILIYSNVSDSAETLR